MRTPCVPTRSRSHRALACVKGEERTRPLMHASTMAISFARVNQTARHGFASGTLAQAGVPSLPAPLMIASRTWPAFAFVIRVSGMV